MTVRSLTPGTAVRLSFDQGPASVGYVLTVIDKVRVRLEFPSDDRSHERGVYTDRRVTEFVMPHTVLVPVCEWVDVFDDGYGLACSEPGVPTEIEVPCHHDATTTVYVRNPWEPSDAEPSPLNLCPEHTTELLRDALTESARTETIA